MSGRTFLRARANLAPYVAVPPMRLSAREGSVIGIVIALSPNHMHRNTTDTIAVVNRQSAFIRTLRDEVHRYSTSDLRAAALRDQIREEEMRLAKLLAASATA